MRLAFGMCHNKDMRVQIKTIPNAKKESVIEAGGIYVVRVKAVPEKGKANEAVIKLLAKHFKVAKNQIKIIRGLASRHKTVEIK